MIHPPRLLLLASAFLLSTYGSFAQKVSPKDTEDWSRKPPIVTPGKKCQAPSDAIVLFSGKQDLDKWEHTDGSPVKWQVNDEVLTIVKDATDIRTKQPFGSVQLHIEWKTPDPSEDSSNDRGNSGVFLMDHYELQIYESYHDMSEIYYNGQAASVYKQHIPLVNASNPPQTWQTYDVVFNAPEFNPDKTLKKPAYITVFHNGVLVLNHAEIKGPMLYEGYPEYTYHAEKLPIRLQEHDSRVSFRNIWVREL